MFRLSLTSTCSNLNTITPVRSQRVWTEHRQAITNALRWPANSPNMPPIKHDWDETSAEHNTVPELSQWARAGVRRRVVEHSQALLARNMSSQRWRRQDCICANGGPNVILTAKICLGCNQRDALTHPAKHLISFFINELRQKMMELLQNKLFRICLTKFWRSFRYLSFIYVVQYNLKSIWKRENWGQ